MEEQVISILSDILRISRAELMAGYDSRDIWDSMHRIEVLLAIEEEFDLQFDEDALAGLDTPEKLVQAVVEAAP